MFFFFQWKSRDQNCSNLNFGQKAVMVNLLYSNLMKCNILYIWLPKFSQPTHFRANHMVKKAAIFPALAVDGLLRHPANSSSQMGKKSGHLSYLKNLIDVPTACSDIKIIKSCSYLLIFLFPFL